MSVWRPPLQVVGLLASRAGDDDRGPEIRLTSEDARMRLVLDGELVWVQGPRRRELAKVVVDDDLRRGEVVLRDMIAGAPSEIVSLIKIDTDSPGPRGRYA
jgi:anaerobic selenocysteine-containing dehydrogenase